MVLTFGLLLGSFAIAFAVLSLACALVATTVIDKIRGTDFESHVSFLAEAEKKDVEAHFWRQRRRLRDTWVGSNGFGYNPFNASLWDRFVDADETPEVAQQSIRRLRMLTRARRLMLFAGGLALLGLIVSSVAN